MGDCDLCGVDNLPIYLVEEEGSSNAIGEMETFFYGTYYYQKWGGKKLKFVSKSIVSSELMEYPKPKLQFFVHHNFVAKLQIWSNLVWKISQMMWWFLWLILQKTTTLKFRTKCNPCTNIVTKWPFWFTFLGLGTHVLILMMKLPKPSWNTTFTFLMTTTMIVILCNNVYSCIGIVWWQVGLGQINIGYGLMVVIRNSKVKYLVVFCQSIPSYY